MSNDLDKRSAWVGALVAPTFLAVLAVSAIVGGFVLSTLWNWFAAGPTGFRLTIAEAIGLNCIYSLLTLRFQRVPLPSDEKPTAATRIVRWLSLPLLLLVGYVAQLYIGGR